MKQSTRIKVLYVMACFVITLSKGSYNVYAESIEAEVEGSFYRFDEKNNYDFSSADTYEAISAGVKTYGRFILSGTLTETPEINGVPSFQVQTGDVSFLYTYEDSLLSAADDEWHLVDDKSKKIDDMKLDSNIMKGALIIQTSRDGLNWVDDVCITNIFADTPIQTESVYTTNDVQLINGCYYRVILAYKTGIRTERRKFLSDKYEYNKYAEVYRFYLKRRDDAPVARAGEDRRYSLGVKTKTDSGYFTEKAIEIKDIHYGWDMGNFFVSGYTEDTKDADGNPIFLKNVNDKVTLWFNLKQDINCLNGDRNLIVFENNEGYDQYFETPKMKFGRGTLIIRYTDYENVTHEPIIYTNFLEANTLLNADTKIQLFDEGDYEVALDYEIKEDKAIDDYTHYRIFFEFSVRNGNCMIFLHDVSDGSELTNSAITENGFELDLARSRYLKINIKKEILKDGADGLVEDTRFNRPAKSGDKYEEQGVYTVTAVNQYTGQQTIKKIYVGNDKILKAHLASGLSISEIREQIALGAKIENDGTIIPPEPETTEESQVDKSQKEETLGGIPEFLKRIGKTFNQ